MKPRATVWALALVLATCAAAVHAQAQNQNSQSAGPSSPSPATSSPATGGGYGKRPTGAGRGVSSANDPQPYDPSQVTPDANTLAGAQLFGVGSLEHSHNVFDPSFSVSELGQTFPGASGQTYLSSATLVGGGLNFNRVWDRYRMTAIYSGGETFNRGYFNLNSPFHNLTFIQEIDWARWHLLLRDDFIASPGAAFTGSGMGGPGIIAQVASTLESSLNSIGQGFVPSETIQTGNATRYRNAVLGQAEYSFSRRSAFTVAASYGLLQFTAGSFISSRMLNAQAGYDYMLDSADSIALLASYGKIDYAGTSTSTTNYLGALAYGRRITGRWAFQVAGGPEQIRTSSASGGFQLWYASVSSALTYERRRNGYSLSFMRGLDAGSGVFQGAKSNIFTLTAHRQFTRHWTGSVTGGYAINSSIAPAGVASARFDNWFVGGSFGRQLGLHALIAFNYGVQKQNSSAACPVTGCGVNGLQQSFGMTVNWHLRPNG